MTTITPRLATGLGPARFAFAHPRIPLAAAAAPFHGLAVPAIFAMIAAAVVFRLILRVNAELASLLTQVVRTLAAIGQMLTAVVIAIGVAVILLMHL